MCKRYDDCRLFFVFLVLFCHLTTYQETSKKDDINELLDFKALSLNYSKQSYEILNKAIVIETLLLKLVY